MDMRTSALLRSIKIGHKDHEKQVTGTSSSINVLVSLC